MAFFEKALEANVMSTHLLIRANVSKKILFEAYQIATDFEQRYSAYKKDSFLNLINAHAGKDFISCTPDDYTLFHTAINASKHTHGLFDITIGALSHGVYHFGFSNQNKAPKHIINKQKKLVNYQDILLTKEGIKLKKKGMRIDLGGIGKGYVAKQIALYLETKGATKILVDVGGEIITRGKKYTIALKGDTMEKTIAILKTSKEDISISTSGSYERFIDQQNHHILHTSSGVSSNHYRAMTLIKNGWDSAYLDAYATALFNQDSLQVQTFANTFSLAILAIDTHAKRIEYNLDMLRIGSLEFIS